MENLLVLRCAQCGETIKTIFRDILPFPKKNEK